MLDPISLQVFLKVLPTLAQYTGQQAYKLVKTPAKLAISATARNFPKYPNLSEWLSDWCASPEFFELQASLKEGDRIEPSSIVDSFVKFIGYVDPDHGQRCAEEVLPVFFKQIDEQLFGSPGLAIIDQRNEARFEQLSTENQQILGELGAEKQRILNAILSLENRLPQLSPAPTTETHTRNEEERSLNAQLEDAKKLLDSGHSNAAKLILDQIQPKILTSDSPTGLRFRFEALIGSFHLHVNDPSSAGTHLSIAVNLEPENARANANLSNALSLMGRKEEALQIADRAVALAPNDGYVASVYVRRLVDSHQATSIDAFVQGRESFFDDPYFLYVVADAWYSNGRTTEVENLLASKLKSELAFAPAWELLGRILVTSAQQTLQTERILPWRMPDGVRKSIAEAERAFSEAIKLIESTEVRPEIAFIYVNRALARNWLGQFSLAESDCDRALSLKPDLDGARHAKAMRLIERKDYQGAVEQLRRIDPAYMAAETRGALGFAYLGAGRPRDAAELLESVFRSEEAEPRHRIRVAELLTRAYRDLGDSSSAIKVVDEILSTYPEEPEAVFLSAERRETTGDVEGARRAMEGAFESADQAKRGLLALDLAAFYCRHGWYDEAARIYEQIAGPGMHDGIRLNYLGCLLNSGQIGKAYHLARKTRTEEGFNAKLAEFEAQICEHIGDLDEADSLHNRLTSEVPDRSALYRVRIATNVYRRGDETRCKRILEPITKRELVAEPELLMQVAKLRHWLDMGGSLDFAYEAWLADGGRAELALSYLLISLARDDKDRAILEPDVADAGCRVRLSRGSESRVVDLVGESEPESAPSRVRITSVLGTKLLHVRKADRLNLGDGMEYAVEDVQSKHVAARQDILRDFPFAFPGHPGLRRIDINPEDLTPIFAQVENRHDFATAALRFYREKHMTLGTLSSVLGDPMLDVWLSLVRVESSERVLAAEGTQPEVDRESMAVTHAADIVIEPTGLLTLARLGRLSLLKRRFQNVYVAQHVLDDFFEARAKGEFGPSPGGWIGKVDGRYAMSDRPNEGYATDRKAILGDVVNFLTTDATVVPCHLQLQYPRQQFDDFERTLGTGPIASIMVAKELHLPLYSDDLMLRVTALNEWAVHSFWTQRLLVDAKNRGFLSVEEHFDAISELIRSHYHFVQIDVQYLLWLFRKHRLALSPEVMRGVGVLGDPACSLTSAVDVAADVVTSCWANLLPDHFRHMVLDAVLGAVTQGRSSAIVLSAFRIAIGRRLGPRSRALMEIQASLRLWERVLF